MRIDEFLSHLKKVKRQGKGYMACCPAHDDRNPSLSVSEGDDGRILLKCFADCDIEAVVASIGLNMSDLFPDKEEPLKSSRMSSAKSVEPRSSEKIVATYGYVDAEGRLLYEKVRYEPKDFRWRRPDGVDGFIYSIDGVNQVPYCLPDLLTALQAEDPEIWFTEGEKDCESVRYLIDYEGEAERGLSITDFKNLESWSSEIFGLLKNARVVIWCDHDNAGRNLADAAARKLSSVARSVKVIDLFEHEKLERHSGSDISDWIAEALNCTSGDQLPHDEVFEELKRRAEISPEWQSTIITLPERRGLEIEYLSNIQSKTVEWLCKPLIPKSFFTLVDGIEGIGKTFLMLDIAKRLTVGLPMPFCGETHEVSKVLFLSMEDSPEYILRPRFEAMGGNCELLAVLTGVFELNDDGLTNLEHTIESEGVSFVLIDPIFSFTGKVDVNNGSEVRRITDNLNQIAARNNVAIVAIRHINKAKGFGESRSAGSHSIAWLQGSRSALLVGHDVEDKSRRGIAQQKLNIGPESKTVYGFKIGEGGKFIWTGESNLTIAEMLSHKSNISNDDRSAVDEAVDFLENILGPGARLKREIDEEAKGAGISSASLNRAKKVLEIKPEKEGYGWVWKLPGQASQ